MIAMTYDVAVLGCGLMGSAFARRFSAAGLAVIAWNRTPARAAALSAHGINPTQAIEEAISSARLVVVCLSDVDAVRAALEPVPGLAGVTIVNLSDGTRDEVVALANWLGERGAAHLDGATFCYPDQVGEPGAMLVFSGPARIWTEHGDTLMLLGGRSRHLAEGVAEAKALYLGSGGFFMTALSGFVESTAFLLRRGRSLDDVRDSADHVLELLRYATGQVAAAIQADDHETDQATIHVFADGARKALVELEGERVESSVLAAATRKLIAAEEAGMGLLGYSAQARLTPAAVHCC